MCVLTRKVALARTAGRQTDTHTHIHSHSSAATGRCIVSREGVSTGGLLLTDSLLEVPWLNRQCASWQASAELLGIHSHTHTAIHTATHVSRPHMKANASRKMGVVDLHMV